MYDPVHIKIGEISLCQYPVDFSDPVVARIACTQAGHAIGQKNVALLRARGYDAHLVEGFCDQQDEARGRYE